MGRHVAISPAMHVDSNNGGARKGGRILRPYIAPNSLKRHLAHHNACPQRLWKWIHPFEASLSEGSWGRFRVGIACAPSNPCYFGDFGDAAGEFDKYYLRERPGWPGTVVCREKGIVKHPEGY